MFALIYPDLTDTGKRKVLINSPGPVPNHPAKPYWVPIESVTNNTSTGPDTVASAWVETIEAARILRTRTIRDKMAAELDAEDTARIDALLTTNGPQRALVRMTHNLNNRVRVLEGDAPLTLAQFKTALLGLVR